MEGIRGRDISVHAETTGVAKVEGYEAEAGRSAEREKRELGQHDEQVVAVEVMMWV